MDQNEQEYSTLKNVTHELQGLSLSNRSELEPWINRIKRLKDAIKTKNDKWSRQTEIYYALGKKIDLMEEMYNKECELCHQLIKSIDGLLEYPKDHASAKRFKSEEKNFDKATLEEQLVQFELYPPDIRYFKLVKEYMNLKNTLENCQNELEQRKADFSKIKYILCRKNDPNKKKAQPGIFFQEDLKIQNGEEV